MASTFNLGTGLGNYFRARMAAPQVEAAAQAQAERQQLQDQLLQGKVGDQRAADAAWNALNNETAPTGVSPDAWRTGLEATRATGSKVDQFGNYLHRLGDAWYLHDASNKFNSGDTARSNFDLAAGGAKPIDYTKVNGGVGYNPNVVPLGQHFKPVPGQGAKRSVIPLSDVNAKVFMQPVPQYNPYDGKPLVDATGKPVTKLAFNPQAYAKFNQWAMDNGFTDMNLALPHYLKQTQAAATAAPAAGEAQARATISKALSDASAAITAGAPRDAVLARLQKMGATPAQIKAAGLQ